MLSVCKVACVAQSWLASLNGLWPLKLVATLLSSFPILDLEVMYLIEVNSIISKNSPKFQFHFSLF